ncbi:MAG: hypothetical protein IKO62_05940 [Bacteroidales bacterium]|nr:hypothetical protein [Bacteroidales bacterium]
MNVATNGSGGLPYICYEILHKNGKKVHKVNFVTAGRVTDPKEFTLKKYIKIY